MAQEWLAQIQQHRESTPSDHLCTVLDAAAALPCPPSAAWRVTFLGTGGALPSKHRNVSGILLSYKCVFFVSRASVRSYFAAFPTDNVTLSRTSSGDLTLTQMRHILLDCGEGTFFQLVRLVGPVQASAIISALDFVWLSHAHADHHLGLLEIARDFFRITGHALKVFAPRKLHMLVPRKSDPGVEEAEVHAVPWLTLVSAWEGVPIEVTNASSLSEEASGASDSASVLRKHVPSCELLGVTAARVAHRFQNTLVNECCSKLFFCKLRLFQLLRRLGY